MTFHPGLRREWHAGNAAARRHQPFAGDAGRVLPQNVRDPVAVEIAAGGNGRPDELSELLADERSQRDIAVLALTIPKGNDAAVAIANSLKAPAIVTRPI